jgi:hypothetical protein
LPALTWATNVWIVAGLKPQNNSRIPGLADQ